MKRAVIVLVCALAMRAHADAESDADAAFRAAEQHAAQNDPHAIDELEAVGAMQPVSRWTDDAWSEAARLAERAGDYARAKQDLERAIAAAPDEQALRRLRASLARIESAAGSGGEWSAVAAEHDRLEKVLIGGGNPAAALAQLEALVTANRLYPRAALAMLLVAQVHEREGDRDGAIAWLERAQAVARPADRVYLRAELARARMRAGDLDGAREEIDRVASLAPEARGETVSPRAVAVELRRDLARAERRAFVRWVMCGLLLAIAAAAALALRRAAGSWRVAGRRIVRPPVEVLYLVPIALVLVVVAATGNPLVAHAVDAIAIAGAAVAWISGAILDAVRARAGRVRLSRAAIHALVAIIAVGASAYLAVDRDRMIDLVIETWRNGPEAR